MLPLKATFKRKAWFMAHPPTVDCARFKPHAGHRSFHFQDSKSTVAVSWHWCAICRNKGTRFQQKCHRSMPTDLMQHLGCFNTGV
eukprot:3788128-Amphidinium_carterae.1